MRLHLMHRVRQREVTNPQAPSFSLLINGLEKELLTTSDRQLLNVGATEDRLAFREARRLDFFKSNLFLVFFTVNTVLTISWQYFIDVFVNRRAVHVTLRCSKN